MDENKKDEPEKVQKKKKQTHHFESYLNKIIKRTSPANSITLNAKQQLSSYICSFIFTLTDIACKLATISKKKTLGVKEYSNALHILLQGKLLEISIQEGLDSVGKYQESKGNLTSTTSRQVRSGIIYPPSLVDKLIRIRLHNKLVLSSIVPIFVASVSEFISYEILDLSIFVCKKNRRSRVTVNDIVIAVESDSELSSFYNKLNVNFLGVGVVSETFSLFNDANKSATKTKSILSLQKLPFKNLVKLILHKNLEKNSDGNREKISKMSYIVLQYFIEQYISKLLLKANYLTIHAGRKKMIPNDILLAQFFETNQKSPYNVGNFELLSLS